MKNIQSYKHIKLLMIGEIDLSGGPNHRRYHISKYFASKCKEVDFVNSLNLYDGPKIGQWSKILIGIKNLFYHRITIEVEGNYKLISIRKLKLPKTIQNIFGDLWIYYNLRKLIQGKHYDIYICSGAYGTFLINLFKKKNIVDKVLYDDYDYLPDGLDAKNIIDKSIIKWKERIGIKFSDSVFSVSKALSELRVEQGAKKAYVIPNGVDLNHFTIDHKKAHHPRTLVYMGSLLESWGIDLVLYALPLIREKIPDIRFLVIGGGEYKSELLKITKDLMLTNSVSFIGGIPYKDLPKYLKEADVGVAIYKKRKFTEFNCPQKIMEYMCAGLPVVNSNFGAGKEIIIFSGAGELADNHSTSISSAIFKILETTENYEKYSKNAINYSKKFDWKIILEAILKDAISL